MLKGARLIKMHNRNSGASWYVVPGGEVTEPVAQRMISRGDIISMEDGLFPNAPQSYRVVGAP